MTTFVRNGHMVYLNHVPGASSLAHIVILILAVRAETLRIQPEIWGEMPMCYVVEFLVRRSFYQIYLVHFGPDT